LIDSRNPQIQCCSFHGSAPVESHHNNWDMYKIRVIVDTAMPISEPIDIAGVGSTDFGRVF
jgi:hypothetical protein